MAPNRSGRPPFKFTACLLEPKRTIASLVDSRRQGGRAGVLPDFKNEPLTDFSREDNRKAFAEALKKVESRLPIEGKNRIGGEKAGAAGAVESVNPCGRKQGIGRVPEGTREGRNR